MNGCRRQYLLVSLVSTFLLFLVLSPKVHAAYTDIPQFLPETTSQYINLTRNSGGNDAGPGANLPQSIVRMYSTDNANKTVELNLVNRGIGAARACNVPPLPAGQNPYFIRVGVLSYDWSSYYEDTITPGACTAYSLPIQGAYFKQNPETGHNSGGAQLYEAFLIFTICTPTGSPYPNDCQVQNPATASSATFRLGVTGGAGRIAFSGGQSVTIYPSISNTAYGETGDTSAADGSSRTQRHTMTFKFKPPCGYGGFGSSSNIYVDDIDTGVDPTENNINYSLSDSPDNGSSFTITPGTNTSGTWTIANAGVQTTTFSPAPNRNYQFVMDYIRGGNGLQVNVPFDMGNFYLPCTPPQPPRITVDGVSTCGSVYGWAFDPDNSGASISVHIYKGGPAGGGGTMVGNISADQPRGDVNAAYGIAGNHGFNFVIPAGDRDGADKTYYVYAIDSNGTDNTGADPYFRPGYSGGTNPITMTGCGPFKLVPSVSGEALRPNDESPTQFCGTVRVRPEYSGWAGGASPANGVPASANYRFEKDGAVVSGPTNYPGNNGNNRFIDSSQEYCIGVSGYTLGNKYCLILSISPTDGFIDRNGNVISSSGAGEGRGVCDDIVNNPYFRAYGADVAAGGGFDGINCGNSASMIKSYLFPIGQQESSNRSGSGAQLAAFGLGRISGFMSASTRSVAAPFAPRGLTFSNNNPASFDSAATGPDLGGMMSGSGLCPTDYFKTTQYPDGSPQKTKIDNSTADISITTIQATDKHQTLINTPSATGKVRLIGNGTPTYTRHNTVYVDGDVFILGNIMYNPVYVTGVNNIPSFALVVRGNIYVDNDVSQLDGLYVAQPHPLRAGTGRIYTCAKEGGAVPNSAVIDQNDLFSSCGADTGRPVSTLVVNGAFIADRVVLNRTLKSLRDSRYREAAAGSAAAEVFNLSPEIYLSPPFFLPTGTSTGGKYDYFATLAPIL